MAHQGSSAPLVYTNGAPAGDTPLVWKTLMAQQRLGAPLVLNIFFFIFSYILMAHQTDSAPLLVLTSNGAPDRQCAITVIFFILFCDAAADDPPHPPPLHRRRRAPPHPPSLRRRRRAPPAPSP